MKSDIVSIRNTNTYRLPPPRLRQSSFHRHTVIIITVKVELIPQLYFMARLMSLPRQQYLLGVVFLTRYLIGKVTQHSSSQRNFSHLLRVCCTRVRLLIWLFMPFCSFIHSFIRVFLTSLVLRINSNTDTFLH